MKILLAIVSCGLFKENGNNQAVRDTWLKELHGVDYKIFMGQGSTATKPDEVVLEAPDDYHNVTYKTKEMYKYAYRNNYDYIFKCYPDTYVCPSRLLLSGFEQYDYLGNYACKPLSGSYCCGGTGYWTSRAAYEHTLGAHIPTEDRIIEFSKPKNPASRMPSRVRRFTPPVTIKNIDTWAEDKWSGDVFSKLRELKKKHDGRYEDNVTSSGPEVGNTKITQHLSRPILAGQPSMYDKQWMYDKHNAWLESLKRLELPKKIAVVTPTLPSRKELLQECKDSVKQQIWNGETYHAIGADLTGEGAALTRNKIVQSLDSSYEWIAFLDDDDKFLPNHLAVVTEACSGADVVYSECKEEGFQKTWNTRDFNYEAVRKENYIPVTALVRRSAFEKVGGFKEKPYPGEDQWLWLRMYEAGCRLVYVPQETWIYRQHPQHRESQRRISRYL
jgi:hypothetical protein